MALQGTLKDFGIADILQLIGQQQKTGVLHLRSLEHQIEVNFLEGAIVSASTTTRKKKDLIGARLVRAEVITDAQLQSALDIQKRSLGRLGDLLVAAGAVSEERFQQMVQLQTTETLYGLFSWKTGTYRFEQKALDLEGEPATPLRIETVLMEGFRRVDEWPMIKKKISTYQLTFLRLKELPPAVPQREPEDDVDFDNAFAEEKKAENKGEFKSVGEVERKVFLSVGPDRDVRKLIDLSGLGEFETCKALCNLVNLEYLRPLAPKGKTEAIDSQSRHLGIRVVEAAGRVLGTMLVLAALALLGSQVQLGAFSLVGSPASTYADPAAQRFLSRQQMSRISSAIDVYRLDHGEVPERLVSLVDEGLLNDEDLHHPWRDAYHYRRTAPLQFVLLPPLR